MYDVLIVGAGPTGMFAALELMKSGKKIAMLDAGLDLEKKNVKLKLREYVNIVNLLVIFQEDTEEHNSLRELN